ncbi:uncharacterized protein [Eurosta solidaginis]|uniref:uncharacterized protein n=1 Tax=Eurosta solidaginis TaxID=178769 RepID=UPI003530637B
MLNLAKVIKGFESIEKCIYFAEENGLILKSKACKIHKVNMPLVCKRNNSLGTFQCRKGSCRANSGLSRAKVTWFEKSKISLPQIFYLMYAYARRWPTADTRLENFVEGTTLSSCTITDWFNYCREVVVTFQLDQQKQKGKIGGPGKVVQIDESKFGKRKYNKGRSVEGHWVLGMIEDGSDDLRLEVCPKNDRSADALIPLIKKHVVEGTTIRTYFWKAYDCLPKHWYLHSKVNHSDPGNPFVAPDDTHTQRIESQWRVVKKYFYKENYNHPANFEDILVEFLWRRSVLWKHEDPFKKLMEAIEHIYVLQE